MKKLSYTICVSELEMYQLMREKEKELRREGKEVKQAEQRKLCTDAVDYIFAPFEHFNRFYEMELRGRCINSLQFTSEKLIKLSVEAWFFLVERRKAGGEMSEDL